MTARREGSPSNLTKTHAFYEDANNILRVAVILTLVWPLFAVLASVYLSPKNAQMIVTLIGLSLIVPVFVFIVGNPFQYFLYVQDPDIRTGARWIAGLLGAELSLVIYLYIVPIRDDPSLVPLLILVSFALFFFSLAHMVSWLRVLLAALLIGITIVFVLGGREKIRAAFKREQAAANREHAPIHREQVPPVNTRRIQQSQAPRPAQVAAQPVAAVNPDAPCPSEGYDIDDFNAKWLQSGAPPADKFRVNVYFSEQNRCFGAKLVMPDFFTKGYCVEPFVAEDKGHTKGLPLDPNHVFSISFLFHDGAQPYGPYHWTDLPQDNVYFLNKGLTFRIKGTSEPGGGATFFAAPRGDCPEPAWPSQGSSSNGSKVPADLLPSKNGIAISDRSLTLTFVPSDRFSLQAIFAQQVPPSIMIPIAEIP